MLPILLLSFPTYLLCTTAGPKGEPAPTATAAAAAERPPELTMEHWTLQHGHRKDCSDTYSSVLAQPVMSDSHLQCCLWLEL